MNHYLRIKREKPLRVSDLNLRCVAFVAEAIRGTETDEDLDPYGTGFFVGYPSRVHEGRDYLYFVTAKHLITDQKDRTDRVRLVVNKPGGGVTTLEKVTDRWGFHPTDKTADVAVMPSRLRHLDLFFKTKNFLTPELILETNIGIGDEVFMTGLFTYAVGRNHNMPIIRYGNIAMLPKEPIQTEMGFADVYLVEARSIGGISGSPVFARQTIFHEIADPKDSTKRITLGSVGHTYLLGLMHGHWDVNESDLNKASYPHDPKKGVNLGIGIVVPAIKILETLNHPELAALRDAADRADSRVIVPSMDIGL